MSNNSFDRSIAFFDLISKIALPIAIAYFGWTQHQMTAKFDKSKLDKEIMLKFIEISWNSLNSKDTIEIKNAIRLISTIDPKYSIQLLDVLLLDSTRTESARKEIKRLSRITQESIIEDLQIEIHYTFNALEDIAKGIEANLLDETRLTVNNIDLRPKRRVSSMVCENEIIYSEDNDFQRVRALQSFINNSFQGKSFNLRKQRSMASEKVIINICK
ncbi:hypothetical protein [Rufibacter ruber]|uniref:hypothetical protein n=1 Tax=Rufibacter ruber TaxID=1783499 RepID=UPI0008358348|nr:hypothetical protein [Rufibacter ruber]